MKRFFGILLLAALTACAAANISSEIWQINNSVETMKAIVENNRDRLTPEEMAALEASYQGWHEIMDELKAHGCGLSKIAHETCRLDMPTVRYLHKTAKDDYLSARAVALEHWEELSVEDRLTLQQFQQKARELDKALRDFQANPNSEGTLALVTALSALAKVAVKVTPIILGLL